MTFIISLAIAYLLGSVSTGVVISKLFKLPDPRKEGSGNAGATNVLRLNGKKQAHENFTWKQHAKKLSALYQEVQSNNISVG